MTRVWRGGLAGLVLLAAGYLSVLAAFGFGSYYLTDVGAARLREQAGALLFSATVGVAGVAWAQALLERRVTSAWLLVGLVPALAGVLDHTGLTR